MRVIIANRFSFPDESATSRMMSSLAFGLAAQGIDVHVVSGRQAHDGAAAFAPHDRIRGVSFHRVRTTRFGRSRLASRAADYASYHVSAGWRIRRLARAGDIVIVGTDPPLFSITAVAALAGSRSILVNWLLDLFPEAAIELGLLHRGGQISDLLCRWRDMSLRRARLNVAPIGRMAELLVARGISAEKLLVVDQWSDGDAIRPIAPEGNPLRKEWALQGRFVVGYSGNFGRVHEFGTILDAAERLRDRNDIAFLFIGNGQRKAWVEAEIQRRSLGNIQTHPLQPRERLSQSLAAADVHLVSLLPALEACSVPSKFYGILAAGRPTLFVGDRNGEIARVIARNGCGAAVQIGEAEKLATHITDLADSPDRYAAMAVRARQTFEAEFHETIGIGAWQSLIVSLAAAEKREAGEAAGAPLPSWR
jgi:colanic acid biosynthesis glycosyl transferase WcaI